MSGRGIAVLFGLPALYFLQKGWIVKPMKPRLVIYGGLLAFQVSAVCLVVHRYMYSVSQKIPPMVF